MLPVRLIQQRARWRAARQRALEAVKPECHREGGKGDRVRVRRCRAETDERAVDRWLHEIAFHKRLEQEDTRATQSTRLSRDNVRHAISLEEQIAEIAKYVRKNDKSDRKLRRPSEDKKE